MSARTRTYVKPAPPPPPVTPTFLLEKYEARKANDDLVYSGTLLAFHCFCGREHTTQGVTFRCRCGRSWRKV